MTECVVDKHTVQWKHPQIVETQAPSFLVARLTLGFANGAAS